MANIRALLIMMRKKRHSLCLLVQNESGFLHFSGCINVCVCECVTHIVARLSNLKPGLWAHLSLVVDRQGLAARRSIHLYC